MYIEIINITTLYAFKKSRRSMESMKKIQITFLEKTTMSEMKKPWRDNISMMSGLALYR